MKKRCELFVPVRRYGNPGRCEKRKSLKRVAFAGREITACVPHAKMIAAGRRPMIEAQR